MLDPRGRADIIRIIKELNREGITTILITHFMDEAVEADRVIIMNDGEIMLDGTPVEVFSHMEEIRAADLDVPIAVELSVRLRRRGIGVPDKIVTMKDMVEFICQYK